MMLYAMKAYCKDQIFAVCFLFIKEIYKTGKVGAKVIK